MPARLAQALMSLPWQKVHPGYIRRGQQCANSLEAAHQKGLPALSAKRGADGTALPDKPERQNISALARSRQGTRYACKPWLPTGVLVTPVWQTSQNNHHVHWPAQGRAPLPQCRADLFEARHQESLQALTASVGAHVTDVVEEGGPQLPVTVV